MVIGFERKFAVGVLLAWAVALPGSGQVAPSPQRVPVELNANAMQTGEILGLTAPLARLRGMQSGTACGAAVSVEQLALRQELQESVQAATLEIDSALGELLNERNELGDLRTALEARRDRTVGLLNAAALITGSGLGAAVSATQFTTNNTRTQNIGDGLGIGSGVASTVLSFVSVKKQKGPTASVGETPNMLAPLLGDVPALNAGYPPVVLAYLRSVPAGEATERGTRLEQLHAAWVLAGRLDASGSAKGVASISAATSSGSAGVKLSIADLTNRIGMLGDVSGRVSLMKRDLAVLVRFYRVGGQECR